MDMAMIKCLGKIQIFLVAMAIICGCRGTVPTLHVQSIRPPIAESSLVPQATRLRNGRILVSWQRPLPSGGYAFEMSIGSGDEWSEMRTIASGENLSMFSADLPAVAQLPDGKLLAYWELKEATKDDPYATSIQTAISTDEGRTWGPTKTPYGKALAGQHSFISWFPNDQGVGLLWLDADERAKVRLASMGTQTHADDMMGSIGLRYASLDLRGNVTSDSFIDPITCECCPTSAAVTQSGPVVVYRGRQEAPGTQPSKVNPYRATVRDIFITRLQGNQWTKPHRVYADNWVINACPDNGPAVDANGKHVAVAWWTASGNQPKVQVAFSADSGDTFGNPIRVDARQGEGQVTVALLPGGKAAVVGWLEDGQTWSRYLRATGETSSPIALGPAPFHSRLPRWIANGDDSITAVWTRKDQKDPRVSVSRISF